MRTGCFRVGGGQFSRSVRSLGHISRRPLGSHRGSVPRCAPQARRAPQRSDTPLQAKSPPALAACGLAGSQGCGNEGARRRHGGSDEAARHPGSRGLAHGLSDADSSTRHPVPLSPSRWSVAFFAAFCTTSAAGPAQTPLALLRDVCRGPARRVCWEALCCSAERHERRSRETATHARARWRIRPPTAPGLSTVTSLDFDLSRRLLQRVTVEKVPCHLVQPVNSGAERSAS